MKLRNKQTGDIYELNEFCLYDDKGFAKRPFLKSIAELGFKFGTREEAKRAAAKLKALTRLKDKGFRFTGWYSSGDTTNTIRIYAEFPDVELGPIVGNDLALLFGGEE